MDAEDLSMTAADSPLAPGTNPSTPQVSNPGTPRHDSDLLLAAAASGVTLTPVGGGGSIVTGAVSSSSSAGHHHHSHHHGHHHSSSSSLSHHGHHLHHLSSASLSSSSLGSLSSHVSLLSHVSSPSVLSAIGPGMVPQGSSITQSLVGGTGSVTRQQPQSKYAQLLAVIEDLGKDIRPTYAGSKSSAERLKRGIVHARILKADCKITRMATFDTRLNADSVEWCPTIDDRSILICGCYQQLQKEGPKEVEPEAMPSSKNRLGCLHLLSVSGQESDDCRVDVLQKLDVPAVLDVKWCPQLLGTEEAVVGVANANGEVALYTFKDDILSLLASNLLADDCIALSLDWSTAAHTSDKPLIGVSDSHGKVSVLNVSSELRRTHYWKAHDHESWIVAFDCFNPSLLYSGGDDAKLKGWDLRQPTGVSTFVSSNHRMGVTSIQTNWSKENILVTGSYDEHILMWDVRKMKVSLCDFYTGGGVWRLKFSPHDSNVLLAACMHNGVWLCDGADGGHLAGVATYKSHDSLAYGIDWCRQKSSSVAGGASIASCSFYDCSLHIWKYQL